LRLLFCRFLASVVAISSTSACVAHLPLDPSFAPRAEELPTRIRSGFWPNDPLVIGGSSFARVSFQKRDAVQIVLPKTTVRFGHDSFRLGFQRLENGVAAAEVSCEGGRPDADGPLTLRCASEAPNAAFVLVATAEGSGFRGDVTTSPRDATFALGAAPLPQGKAVSTNVSGYVIRRGETIEATLDATYLGLPKVWVARDLPPEDRAAMLSTFAALYFVAGRPTTR
jgi:hypothetical protein